MSSIIIFSIIRLHVSNINRFNRFNSKFMIQYIEIISAGSLIVRASSLLISGDNINNINNPTRAELNYCERLSDSSYLNYCQCSMRERASEKLHLRFLVEVILKIVQIQMHVSEGGHLVLGMTTSGHY